MLSIILARLIGFALQTLDGVQRRCLPALYKSLEPGTDDDRMKGALWTLNLSTLGMFLSDSISSITHVPHFVAKYAIGGEGNAES